MDVKSAFWMKLVKRERERVRSFTLGCWQLANFCRFVFLWLVFSFCFILLKWVFLTTFFLIVAFCWSMWCIIFIIKLGSSLLKCNFLLHCITFFCIIVLCFSCCCASVLHSQICCRHMHSLTVMFVMKDHDDFYFFSHVLASTNSLYIVFHWSMGCIIVFLLCVIVHQSATSYSISTSFLFFNFLGP